MRREETNLIDALNKAAEDIYNKGHFILEGWRIKDLLKEAAINLKHWKELIKV